jgi:hypothetical protein
MKDEATKARLGGGSGLVLKVRVSVQLLFGSAAVTMTYFMFRCMDSCSTLLQSMHHYP